jgi:putative ABC transport system permease protein
MSNIRLAKIRRDLWLYRSRTILAVLAVAIGVAAFGTMHAGRLILQSNLADGFAATHPPHAILTLSDFDDQLIAQVEQLPQVEQAEGRRLVNAKVESAPDNWISLELQAIPHLSNLQIGRLTFADNPTSPLPADSVLLERSTQQLLNVSNGQTIHIRTLDGVSHSLIVNGAANDLAPLPSTITLIANGYLPATSLARLNEPAAYNQLYLILAGRPPDRPAVEQQLTPVVAAIEDNGFTVHHVYVPEPGKPILADNMESVLNLLATLGRLTLLLSAFLIFNVMTAIVTQQIPQIGILKSLGGRSRDIIALYLQMVLLLGFFALLLAVPLGLIGAYFLATALSANMDFDVTTFPIPWPTLSLQVTMALLVPILAALPPILTGARLTIRQAISHAGLPEAGGRVLHWFAGLPRPLLLSLRNIFRRKGRVALTLAALTLAGAMFVAVLGIRRSLQITLARIQAEANYDVELDFAQPYPAADLEAAALAVPDVIEVESWAIASGRYRFPDGRLGSSITLIGLPATTHMSQPAVRQGQWLAPGQPQTIFVNADAANMTPGLRVGQPATLLIGNEESQWQLTGIGTRNFVPFAYLDRADFEQATGLMGLANRLVIRTRNSDPGAQAAAEASLLQQMDEAGFQVVRASTTTESKETSAAQLDTLVILLLSMALLVTLVGGLGLATTMSLNVLERTREIGVLRALGAQSGSLRQLVMVESLAIGLLSCLLSILLAIPLGLVLGNNLGQTLLLYPLDYTFAAGGAALWIALVIFISIVASLTPAQHAARLSIRDALAYDG